jgi:hypothetical protein
MEKESKGSARIRTVRFLYALLAAGYLVSVVLQVFFAGLGVFVDSGDLQLHREFANYFENVPLLMFLLTFFGRIRGSLRWFPLVLLAVSILQHLTVRSFTGFLPAIHTVDALVLFGMSFYLARRSWAWLLLRRDDTDAGARA